MFWTENKLTYFYPQSNGMTERRVKPAKALLTKAQLSGQDLMMVEAKN